MANKQSFIFSFVSIFLLLFLFPSCVRQDDFPNGKMVLCDAETISLNKKQFVAANDSTFFFDGANKRTSFKAHSGNHSIFTTPGNKAYGFGFKVHNAKEKSYFKISVWRKSKDSKGAIVVSAKNTNDYYNATSSAIEKDENGWEKLEMEFFVPPIANKDNIFSFYVWNNSVDTVYFDDFKIERSAHKIYPEYNFTPLRVSLDTSQFIKLSDKRKIALSNGILQTGDDDWVSGFVFGDNKMMQAKMRLKGDWLDHLKGDKWSLRIKMKKDNAWKRLRTFSIQTPLARNYLLEWASHNFYDAKDILTTSYGFVPIFINNSNKGLFAWEEHFVKQLLESRNRREGPIVKFNEDSFWQIQKMSISTGNWLVHPFFETAVIEPFSTSKTIENVKLYEQFLNAQILMNQYKNRLKPVDLIFDLDKIAAYYAMLDLTHARHGMAWHNQRFYYNPIIGKLEPIAFDGYTDHTKPILTIDDNFAFVVMNQKEVLPEQIMFYDFFKQKSFTDKYLKYLHEFSDQTFVDDVLKNMQSETVLYDSLLKMEFKQYSYDFEFFSKSAKAIRDYLPELEIDLTNFVENNTDFIIKETIVSDADVFENTPEFFVNAYLQNREGDSVKIDIQNYYSKEIIILGTSTNNRQVEFFEFPEPSIQAYSHKMHQKTIVTDSSSKFLFFMVKDYNETFKVEINLWPFPSGNTPQQELMTKVDLNNNDFIDRIDGQKIFVKNGNFEINNSIIIPKGYEIFFSPETKINFTNSAFFLSYSPIFMNGTKENPIIITSSDFSANGFIVLQAEGRSVIKNVKFENLNTLNYKGWSLTGAVNFYESDVDIDNVTFYRNQCEDALNVIRSDFNLNNSSFDYIFADAFDSDFSTGKVENTVFTNIGNDAIDFSGSEILIENTQISDVNDKGISGGEDSYLIVNNVKIKNANIGIASKDLSNVEVKNSFVNDCSYGIVLLQKKPEYGPAIMTLNNVVFSNSKLEKLIEINSVVIENGVDIKGTEKNVATLFY